MGGAAGAAGTWGHGHPAPGAGSGLSASATQGPRGGSGCLRHGCPAWPPNGLRGSGRCRRAPHRPAAVAGVCATATPRLPGHPYTPKVRCPVTERFHVTTLTAKTTNFERSDLSEFLSVFFAKITVTISKKAGINISPRCGDMSCQSFAIFPSILPHV